MSESLNAFLSSDLPWQIDSSHTEEETDLIFPPAMITGGQMMTTNHLDRQEITISQVLGGSQTGEEVVTTAEEEIVVHDRLEVQGKHFRWGCLC